MLKLKIISAVVALLTALLIPACDGTGGAGGTGGNIKKFDNTLQGTWVSNDAGVYSGSLKIDYDRLTINGYNEGQTPSGVNDNRRPFKTFTKGVALKGYSEDGKIFIEDGGSLQEGIPYTYWEQSSPPDNKKLNFLRFTFGDRVETLQKQ